ncbi:PstC family ABC transporter permease [Pontiella sulfatireligans]|uniref:Phosphate transport system permease protein PstC 1 n=1 Tax=Pontiella sulfatireligans TaxID=2750658 RepID=A0A6C2UKX9_9BACT|nr:PstC family ABC transporter permease [Pontiella sulfatireligans]VGO20061.1 Phosphate transport system permease protein PstC 1 [Pontiella sulfatireligans]
MSAKSNQSLIMSDAASRRHRMATLFGQSILFLITSLSTLTVFFIFYFILKDAIPFFKLEGFKEFFTSARWYPSGSPAEFGALPIFMGTGLVTLGAVVVAVPLGIAASVCLSDLLPFHIRQIVKPIIEILAAIPSVAYGFFALVVFAPMLQNHGGAILSAGTWMILGPIFALLVIVMGDLTIDKLRNKVKNPKLAGAIVFPILGILAFTFIYRLASHLSGVEISSGTNALNVAVILGIMALPTVVSVSEDALQAAGRELREGSYALGATRAETIIKTVIPASISGILAAVILGVMRAIGETMVVWMASGNAARLPDPWYNMLQPVRTLTATIAGDMGEADHVTGSSRFHVLFAMAFCLLAFSFIMNLASELIVKRSRKKLGK